MPSGIVGQRPGAPINGMIRYNQSSPPVLEAYINSNWETLVTSSGSTSSITLGTSASATNPQRNLDATTGLFSPAVDTVAVAAGGAQQLTVNATGVGIGTSLPSSLLHVLDSAAKTVSYIGNEFAVSDTSSTSSVTKTGVDIQSTGTWNGTSAVNIGLNVNATGGTTNYAALFNGGNVGVGTTAPAYTLDIHSATPASASANYTAGSLYLDATPASADNSVYTGWYGSVDNLSAANNGTYTLAGTEGYAHSIANHNLTNVEGVYGLGLSNTSANVANTYGVYGSGQAQNGTLVTGTGVYGEAKSVGGSFTNAYGGSFTASAGTTASYGVYGTATGTATTQLWRLFYGKRGNE